MGGPYAVVRRDQVGRHRRKVEFRVGVGPEIGGASLGPGRYTRWRPSERRRGRRGRHAGRRPQRGRDRRGQQGVSNRPRHEPHTPNGSARAAAPPESFPPRRTASRTVWGDSAGQRRPHRPIMETFPRRMLSSSRHFYRRT
jgi:hypothetical protein